VPLHEWVEGGPPPAVAPAPVSPGAEGEPARRRDAQLAAHPPLGPPPAAEGAFTTWLFEPATFAPLARIADGGAQAIVTDHLGAPIRLFDGEGQEVWSAELDVTGQLRHQAGTPEACPFRWPGQYHDLETGLYYNRFRYYAPEMGCFISKDPIHPLPALDAFGYCADPVTEIDPLGLMRQTGKTRKGMDRLTDVWRRLYGPGVMRNHHVIPQEFMRDPTVSARLTLLLTSTDPRATADDFIHRTIARIAEADHARIHQGGYNRQWRQFFAANPNFTLPQLRQQMKVMMQRFNIPHSAMNRPRYGG
jgi:RHS repeat-associated protein